MIWSALLPSFFASIVEFVEALTIVLAIGTSINWKSSLWGAVVGFLTLAILISVFGTAIILFIPLNVLRVVIGIILVLFGMQWLKKSVLRYTGLKAMHDEAKIYEKNKKEFDSIAVENRSKFNRFGFLTAFKSVLLEGLEVAVIVITFGTTASTNKFQGIFSTTIGAILAFVVVAGLGVVVRKPLTKIPENTFKYFVGIMLTTFGTFWAGEGLGITWPFADLFILVLIAFYLVLTGILIYWLKKSESESAAIASEEKGRDHLVIRILWEIFDFFCGDWTVFWGFAITVLLITLIKKLSLLTFALPALGIIFVAGITISFWAALNRNTRKRQS